jgi:hypothetical protein
VSISHANPPSGSPLFSHQPYSPPLRCPQFNPTIRQHQGISVTLCSWTTLGASGWGPATTLRISACLPPSARPPSCLCPLERCTPFGHLRHEPTWRQMLSWDCATRPALSLCSHARGPGHG